MLNDYTADIAILILIYIALGASLNLLMGYAGQFSMAQAVFYGIGAYSAGLLAVNLGFSPLMSIVGAIVISFISAGILALPAAKRVQRRIPDPAHACLPDRRQPAHELDARVDGRALWLHRPLADPLRTRLHQPRSISCRSWPPAACSCCSSPGASASRPSVGLLKGIREDEDAVRALGKNTTAAKLLVFGITAALAGFIGG